MSLRPKEEVLDLLEDAALVCKREELRDLLEAAWNYGQAHGTAEAHELFRQSRLPNRPAKEGGTE